jgi:HK97 family phage major capsid protein
MKKFKDFLKEKGIEESAFNEMEAHEQLKLQNDYNVQLKNDFETAIKNKSSKEDLDAFKSEITKSFESQQKIMENLALAIKASAEKAGVSVEEKEAPELIKLFLEQKKSMEDEGTPSKIKVELKSSEILNEVNKAAALMTTANIIPIGGGNGNGVWSPLFGNYIDNTIYSAPKLSSSIMEDIRIITQSGTENIYWTARQNEEGDAVWLAESTEKPLIDAEWKTFQRKTAEVAERWKVTTRFLFHVREAVQDFQQHAYELINNKMANGFLTGTGLLNQPHGIITEASAWVTPSGTTADMLNATDCPNTYDVILAMATQIRARGFAGQIVARLNSVWSYRLKTTKDKKGGYLVVPFASPDGSKVDEVTVKFDPLIPAGKVLVGVLSNYTGVISEQAIYMEYLSSDDGDKNLVSRKLETFANGYLPAPLRGSIIYDDIATVLTDIDSGNDCCCGGSGNGGSGGGGGE